MKGVAYLAVFLLISPVVVAAQNSHKPSDEIEEEELSRYLSEKVGCAHPEEDIYYATVDQVDLLKIGYNQAVVVASTCMTGTAGPDVHGVFTRNAHGEIEELPMEEAKLAHRVIFGNANSGYRIDGDTLVEVFVDGSEREDPLVIKYRWNEVKKIFAVVEIKAAGRYQTSYDCDKAEKAGDETALAICYVESLADLDRKLAERYKAYLLMLTPDERKQVVQEQRAWIEERNKSCVIYKFWVDCLDEAYKKRIAELDAKQNEKKLGKEHIVPQ